MVNIEVKETVPDGKCLSDCKDKDLREQLVSHRSDDFLFLAYKEDEIVGFISVVEINEPREAEAYDLPIDFSPGEFEPFIYVEMAHVVKEYRKEGVWSRLRDKLDNLAEEKDLGVVTEIVRRNSFLINRLKERGYKVIAKSRDFVYLWKWIEFAYLQKKAIKIKEVEPDKKFLKDCKESRLKASLKEHLHDDKWILAYEDKEIVGLVSAELIKQEEEAENIPLPGEKFQPFYYVSIPYTKGTHRRRGVWTKLRENLTRIAEQEGYPVVTSVDRNAEFLLDKLAEMDYMPYWKGDRTIYFQKDW